MYRNVRSRRAILPSPALPRPSTTRRHTCSPPRPPSLQAFPERPQALTRQLGPHPLASWHTYIPISSPSHFQLFPSLILIFVSGPGSSREGGGDHEGPPSTLSFNLHNFCISGLSACFFFFATRRDIFWQIFGTFSPMGVKVLWTINTFSSRSLACEGIVEEGLGVVLEPYCLFI